MQDRKLITEQTFHGEYLGRAKIGEGRRYIGTVKPVKGELLMNRVVNPQSYPNILTRHYSLPSGVFLVQDIETI